MINSLTLAPGWLSLFGPWIAPLNHGSFPPPVTFACATWMPHIQSSPSHALRYSIFALLNKDMTEFKARSQNVIPLSPKSRVAVPDAFRRVESLRCSSRSIAALTSCGEEGSEGLCKARHVFRRALLSACQVDPLYMGLSVQSDLCLRFRELHSHGERLPQVCELRRSRSRASCLASCRRNSLNEVGTCSGVSKDGQNVTKTRGVAGRSRITKAGFRVRIATTGSEPTSEC